MEMSIRFPNLNLEFDYVGKAFQIFGFEITIYGILIAVGMLLGIAFVVLEAKRCNQNQDRYLDMMILSLAGAVAGARLFYVAFSWSLYKSNPMEIFNLRSGGSAFYGGLLGGVLIAALFCSVCRLSFWQMADTASMGILIGQILGRWGNFFNRESFGEYTDGLFAMQLPLSAVRAGEVTTAMRENLITESGISYIQVSPVFLYESLWCCLLLLILLVIRRRKKFQGELFMWYLAGYGLGRFFFEWLRSDQLMIPGTGLPVAMLISAALFLIFAPAVWVKRVMSRKRAVARRRRREKIYEAEERAYGEKENTETSETKQTVWSGIASWEAASGKAPETASGTAGSGAQPETSAETSGTETAPGRMETEAEVSEGAEDSDNWENSRYAHISDTWRTAGPSEPASEKERSDPEASSDQD